MSWLIKKTVVLAVENGLDEVIINNLRKMEVFEKEDEWDFFPINHGDLLEGISNPDVIVLSRHLIGNKPEEILKKVKSNFSSSHIVLLVGERSEQSRNYIKLAKNLGMENIVTGELPGTLPYTLDLAIQYPYKAIIGKEEELLTEVEVKVIKPQKDNLQTVFPKSSEAKEIEVDKKTINKAISRKQGFIIASAGAKGGIGKTSVAAGITLALARKGVMVTAVDYDYSRQDLTAFFKVPDFHRIGRDNFNADEIRRSAVMVRDSIYLLPAVGKKAPISFPEAEEVKHTLDALRETNPVIVVDTPSDINCSHTPIILQEADMIIVNIDQTAFSDQDIFDYGAFLLEIGVNPGKVRIVVNRYSKKLRSTKEMIRLFNQGIRGTVKVLTTIPNDWESYANLSHKGEIPRVKDKKSPWQDIAVEIGGHIELPQKVSRFKLRKEA